jgi:hypothetical protein
MSTATHPTLAPQTTQATQNSGGTVLVTVLGSVAAVIGVTLAIAGGSIAAVFGSDGTLASGSQSLSTSRAALVTEVADFDINGVDDVLGDPDVRLSATPTNKGEELFVGIGPAADVDRYLAGVSHDEVTDFDVDPFKLERDGHDGSRRPAAPASQEFWVAQGSGADTAALNWKIQGGDYRMVLMNADGSRGVDSDGEVKVHVPHIGSLAWSLLAGGMFMGIGGIAAIVLSTRRRRNS